MGRMSDLALELEEQGKWHPPSDRFNGDDYVPSRDNKRLTGQIKRVHDVMIDGVWRTLEEISNLTGRLHDGLPDPPASISAQLRHLRKQRFGGFLVNKRHRGPPANGLYEYQLKVA